MDPFAWENSFSVRIEPMDEQHKEILGRMSAVNHAIEMSRDQESLQELYGMLESCSKKHFYDEERLMEMMNYPGLGSHKQQHDLFAAQLDRMRSRQGTRSAGLDAIISLKTWFTNHILTEDLHYSEFFINQPRSETAA